MQRNNNFNPGGMKPVNLDLSKIPDTLCSCGERYFIQVFKVKHVSALQSPNGQAGDAMQPVFVCIECRAELQPGAPTKPGG